MAFAPGCKGVGKKGRSGRKSIAVEFNKFKTIEKAWQKVDSEVDKNLNVATQIVLKDMTVKTDITTNGESLNIYAEQQIENIARRAISISETSKPEGSD
jgi:CO dehydrogenase nickel-insertion accessory protein CooC1